MDGGPGSNSVEQLLKMELITILKHNKAKAGLQRSPKLMKQKRDITDRGIKLTSLVQKLDVTDRGIQLTF